LRGCKDNKSWQMQSHTLQKNIYYATAPGNR
jgi:hypothetical protein